MQHVGISHRVHAGLVAREYMQILYNAVDSLIQERWEIAYHDF